MIIRHIRLGLKYGYPLCCILRFALGPHGRQGEQRGVHYARDGSDHWVPCRIFHQTHRNGEEQRRAAAFRAAPMMAKLEELLAQQPHLHLSKDGRLFYRLNGFDWKQFSA